MNPSDFLGPFRPIIFEVDRDVEKETNFHVRESGTSRVLDGAWEESKQTLWCWAAVAAMVARFYKRESDIEQCAIVSQCLGKRCCDEADACNVEGPLDAALSVVGHSVGAPLNGVLEMAEIVAEIEAFRPIGARISWRGGRGHFVAISGYDLDKQEVIILDPAGGVRPMPLHELKYRFDGAGQWTQIYFTAG